MPEQPSKIATPLAELIARDGNWEQATADASDEFDLLIHVEPGQSDAARDHAESAGATVERAYGDVMFATARADRIVKIANGRAIRKVQKHEEPRTHATTTSEGVNTTEADQLQNLGVTGSNVTVAVIDIYFNPDQTEISDQVVATVGDSNGFRPGTTGLHGTACAEIVAEMLPDANLVLGTALTNFPTLMDDITAAHDPEVMSMSLGYQPTLRLDGQDYLSDRIIEYTTASGSNTTEGGVFAVSAGNEANGSHWDGAWTDAGNGYMDFGGGNQYLEITSNDTDQEIVVQTDVAWSSSQDYLLEIYDSNKNLVKSPTATTDPSQAVTVPDNATSYLRIKDDGLGGSEHFDIFTWGNYVSFPVSTPERSIGIPATCPNSETLSTAAVRHNTDNLEGFSSRGPTQDGRRGVDIAAPDGTQSDAYGKEFYGTSAACPHAAGAAGLLMAFPSMSNVEVSQALRATGRSIGDSSVGAPPNTKIGEGYVDLRDGLDELVGTNQKWTGSTGGRSQYTRPAVDANRVYVGGLAADLQAYSRSDGSSAWSVTRSGSLADSSPVLSGGTVFVGSGGGVMYALNASDGTQVWSASTGSAICSSPAVLSSTVFAGTNDGTVHAWATSDGTAQWSTGVGAPVYGDVAAANGSVFVATVDGDVVALDAATGSEQWRVATNTDLGSASPAVGNSRVFVAADQVYALAQSDGSQAWAHSGYNGTAGSDVAYGAGTVYAGDTGGVVWAIDDAGGGSTAWSVDTGTAAVAAAPSVVGRRVTVPSVDGTMYVFEESDGTEYARTGLPSKTRSTAAVDGSDVYVGTKNGTLVTF
jgi:outer membrane protein assembly factor BamB